MIKSRHLKLYPSIFRITFSISAFTFGGGYDSYSYDEKIFC